MTSKTEVISMEREIILRNAEFTQYPMSCSCCLHFYFVWNIVIKVFLIVVFRNKPCFLFSVEFICIFFILWAVIVMKDFQLKYKVIRYIYKFVAALVGVRI